MNISFTIIYVLLFIMAAFLFFIIWRLSKSKQKDTLSKEALGAISDIGGLKTLLASVENNQKMHNQLMQEMKSIMDGDTKAQGRLQEHIDQTLRSIENIRQSHEDSKHREQENRESLRRLESIIAGTKLKGIAGENILKQALSSFPPRMVQTNVKVKGKEVEFGLVLSNNKVMPIDSKWPTTDLLAAYEKQQDDAEREKTANQIQKEVLKRVSEVSQYIDTSATTPWAIAAVPDSAYALCKSVNFDAYRQNVILISYSMIVPYLLMFFSLHLQYSSTIDIDNLSHYLLDIRRHTEKMSEILDNKFCKAATMVTNASDEYRQIIGSIKGCLSAVEQRSLPEEGEVKEITIESSPPKEGKVKKIQKKV